MLMIIGLLVAARIFLVALDILRQESKPDSWLRSVVAAIAILIALGSSILGGLILIAAGLNQPPPPQF